VSDVTKDVGVSGESKYTCRCRGMRAYIHVTCGDSDVTLITPFFSPLGKVAGRAIYFTDVFSLFFF